MRIAINTRFLITGQLEGIGWFTWEILKRLARDHPQDEFICLFDRPFDAGFITSPNMTPLIVGPAARDPLLWKIWFDWSIPPVLRKNYVDVLLSPDGFLSLRSPVSTCLVLHDLAFEHFPYMLEGRRSRFLRKNSPRFARRAKTIVTVSEFTKTDIVNRYHIPADKIKVIPNGLNQIFRPLGWEEKQAVKSQYAGGKEFLICVGAIHPRKNIMALLKAFSILKRKHRTSMKLVLAGRMAWKSQSLVSAIRTFHFKEDVVLTGYLPQEDLARLLGGAYALVYPSLFEGFGMPLTEAMACGVPVISSGAGALGETGGDAALYFDPGNVEDMAEKMGQVFKDERLRAKLIALGLNRATRFDWDQAALKLWDCLLVTAKA